MAQSPRRVGSYTVAVAEELRAAVERLELTHVDISERTGIPRSTVGKILSGKRAMDVEEIALLAAAVKMSVRKLMTAAEERQRSEQD
ncbi:helix-turn-helix domain-containing protein [Rhodococcus tibetensis]|uniref:Helix-turn-helix domain-containing protein n=1 Tax=Rhodococcus tibetensis TaxID=2965064 RepID=A0ABT1QDP8_9NOCA|nr:helix-turn-helix transcriptional regulator [Rhodococcus sp. FXJ9.536]MCQ4119850.1 helix-turn-helix domain-containing protein [Rhodococcus sp. FXJ9.536]